MYYTYMNELTQLSPVIQKAQKVIISSQEDILAATLILSGLNRLNDNLEVDRLKITKPLNDSLREINAKYKQPKEALANAIASIRLKMSQYQTKAIEDKKVAEDALLARVAPGKGNLKLETAINKLSKLSVDKSVDSGDGKISFVEVEKFEVIDISLIPKEYILANEVEIRKAMKEGIKIAGVRYYKEQQVRNAR